MYHAALLVLMFGAHDKSGTAAREAMPVSAAVTAYTPEAPTSPDLEQRETLVKDLQGRIAEWIKEAGDAEGEWEADRARLEMQLATARLELAAAKLIDAKNESNLDTRKRTVMDSLKLVEHADRTLDRVNIEKLDDFDRRSYRGLSAMRHRVSSLQIHALLGMVGKADGQQPVTPPVPPSTPRVARPSEPGTSIIYVVPKACARPCRCCGIFRRLCRR